MIATTHRLLAAKWTDRLIEALVNDSMVNCLIRVVLVAEHLFSGKLAGNLHDFGIDSL